jgi:hypothetical protein
MTLSESLLYRMSASAKVASPISPNVFKTKSS